jgi:hypothetical protein
MINCPRCVNPFHYDHLAAWLLTEKACPVCREELSEAFREDLRPKTEKEHNRLEQIVRTLDGLGAVVGKWEGSRRRRKRLHEQRRVEAGIEAAPSLGNLFFPMLLGLIAVGSLIILVVAILSTVMG